MEELECKAALKKLKARVQNAKSRSKDRLFLSNVRTRCANND
jgi:hypothetical protein